MAEVVGCDAEKHVAVWYPSAAPYTDHRAGKKTRFFEKKF